MERVAPNGTCAYARARIDTSAISRRSRRTMKAIQYHRFGGPEVLEYVDVPFPSPGAGEVLIETTAVGVNFPDIRERLGIYNQKETRVGGVTLPQIGGVQVVGKVVDTGSGVSADLRGRKVMAIMIKSADAQFAVARTIMTVTLPDEEAIEIAKV